jgi:hypothetical protein
MKEAGMSEPFFDHPILNSPYEYPGSHWEPDEKGQPTQMVIPQRRKVDFKGYRGEDAKDKKLTMDSYWIPGVNHLCTYGRWAFAEFTDVWEMGADFEQKVEQRFGEMVEAVTEEEVLS